MKKKLWIFGDSYSVDWDYIEYSYITQLKQRYDVENFSVSGSGLDYQFKLFNKKLLETRDEDLKNIILVFLIASYNRPNFSFWKDPGHQCFSISIANDYQFDYKPFQKIIKQYRDYKIFIKDFYKFYFTYNENEFKYLEKILILKEFSNFFNKTLAISIFDPVKEDMINNKFKINYNNNNFFFAEGEPLYRIEKEVNKFEPNHLSIENHNLLFQEIYNWIEHNINVNIDNLKKIH